jgi:hypothetical protein
MQRNQACMESENKKEGAWMSGDMGEGGVEAGL